MSISTKTITEKDNDHTFWIPSWNVARLRHKIAQINKRAVKIGCPAVDLIELDQKNIVAPEYQKKAETYGDDYVPKITLHNFRIVGEGPKIGGWKFVGTLDHHTLPGSVIVKTVPGELIPTQFYHNEAVCDHCGKIRRRTETFVLEGIADHNGEWKQVGRNCLRDFFGHDPSAVARHLSSIIQFVEDLCDEESEWRDGGSGPSDWYFDHNQVLAATAAVVRKEGWVPRSAAGYERVPTADVVLQVFVPPPFRTDEQRRAHRAWVESLEIDKFEEEAIAARSWLKEQDSPNEYMHNLHTIDAVGGVPTQLFGYWCSLVSTYQKAQERFRYHNAQKKINDYIGNIKQRLEMKVTVTGIQYLDGYYGTVTLIKMIDDEGRTAVWFANTSVDLEKGCEYNIRATVKKHEEYNDWKQTVLSRVTILEEK